MGVLTPPARRRVVAVVLPALVLITGCSLLVDMRDPSRTGPCSADSDCPALEMCVQNVCQPVCERNSDCASGETCQPLRDAAACQLAARVDARGDGGVEADGGGEDAASPPEVDGGGDASEEAQDDGPASTLDAPSDADGEDEAPAPPPCDGAGASRAVLFGGQSGNDYLGDTWVFDGTASTWAQQPMGMPTPPPRDGRARRRRFAAASSCSPEAMRRPRMSTISGRGRAGHGPPRLPRRSLRLD